MNRIRSSAAAFRIAVLGIAVSGYADRQSSSGFAEEPRHPNVVLIVSDDQRPDTIAALGNPIIRTPGLDDLVRRGVAFTSATCANPICTPSRAEILSGCTGYRNGVFDFGIDTNLDVFEHGEELTGAAIKDVSIVANRS